jgi:DNA end-binding protein Ku
MLQMQLAKFSSSEITKALKMKDGRYVVFTQKELNDLKIKGSQSIEISQFVNQNDVSPMLFEKPYYLTPGKNAEKTYKLFYEILKKTDKFAVGEIVLHFKKHIALISAADDVLILYTLRYPSSIKRIKDLKLPELKTKKIKTEEYQVATHLLDQLTSEWKPLSYKNEFNEEVKRRVKNKKKSKLKEHDVKSEEESIPISKIIDLVPLLKKSLKSQSKLKKRAK